MLMLGVGRGGWWTLRPAGGVSGPHRLKTLAPTEEQSQILDPLRRHDLFHERRKAKDKRRQTTRVRAFYSPREGRVCKYADQNALGGGATPPPWPAIGRAKRGREPLLICIFAYTPLPRAIKGTHTGWSLVFCLLPSVSHGTSRVVEVGPRSGCVLRSVPRSSVGAVPRPRQRDGASTIPLSRPRASTISPPPYPR